jgi:hypothetical protein
VEPRNQKIKPKKQIFLKFFSLKPPMHVVILEAKYS